MRHMDCSPHTALALIRSDVSPPMADRRRHERFVLRESWEGSLQVFEDVIVEQYDDTELCVVSRVPAYRGEVLELDLAGSGGSLTLAVRVAASAPVMIGGAIRHRVRLEVLEESTESEGEAGREQAVVEKPGFRMLRLYRKS